MKTIQMTILLVLLAMISHAQGIQFEKTNSWQQIQANAKAENKLIFVDCYATWCGPCKQMDKEVYPSQKAGDYFNKKFISVKVQMDRTAGDTKEIKDRYALVDTLKKKVQIEGYPTFLFFTADGKLLEKGLGYRSVAGLIMMANDMISKIAKVNKTQSLPAFSVKQLQEAFGKAGTVDYGSDTSWSKKAQAIDEKYRRTQPKLGDGLKDDTWFLNSSAWDVFENCKDNAILERALAWSEVSITLDKIFAAEKGMPVNVQLLDTRANLLHKLGRTQEAIAQEEEAISIDQANAEKMGREKGFFAESYLKIVAKMKEGRATWPE